MGPSNGCWSTASTTTTAFRMMTMRASEERRSSELHEDEEAMLFCTFFCKSFVRFLCVHIHRFFCVVSLFASQIWTTKKRSSGKNQNPANNIPLTPNFQIRK